MGLPPTSPRVKFIHTHPGGSPIPHRPPRQPPSPSARSRSLELLDQNEPKPISTVVQPSSLPRPRSRSLDGFLDEDVVKSEESCGQDNQHEKSRNPHSKNLEDKIISKTTPRESQKEFIAEDTARNNNPTPLPRTKLKVCDAVEDMRLLSSSDKNESDKESALILPSKPSRRLSSDKQLSTTLSKHYDDEEQEQEIKETERATDRLMTSDNDRSMMFKAQSCGAGLDSDDSVSSNEYRSKVKGSLLSLPIGVEPKRKRNFMDKCVNKVRSFMKK